MATKKDRDYSKPFTPPRVSVRVVDEGSRLDLAERAKALAAEDPAEVRELEQHRAALRPSIAAAKEAITKLNDLQRAHKADLDLLRKINFDDVRGLADEGLRMRVERKVRDLFWSISSAMTVLGDIEGRTAALRSEHLRGPRLDTGAPGIQEYSKMPPAAVAHIQLAAEGGVRAVRGLPKMLEAVKQEVAVLIEDVEKKKRNRGETSEQGNIVDPAVLRQREADRPGPEYTTSISFPNIR